MAFTRKMLKAIGIDEEKIDQIMEAHAEVVDALKAQSAENKDAAEKLAEAQQRIHELEADDYKGKYNAERKAHDELKAKVEGERTHAALDKAVRSYYESKGITGKNLNIAMRGTSFKGLEIDGDSIKDTSSLDELVAGDFASLIASQQTSGAAVDKPPAVNTGKAAFDAMSLSDKMKFANTHPAEYAEYK